MSFSAAPKMTPKLPLLSPYLGSIASSGPGRTGRACAVTCPSQQLEQAQAAATAAFWSGGGSLLLSDGITDDTLLLIAHFLPTARDLLCLGLTNTRFSANIIAARRCCRSSRRRDDSGWRGATSKHGAGSLGVRLRAGWD